MREASTGTRRTRPENRASAASHAARCCVSRSIAAVGTPTTPMTRAIPAGRGLGRLRDHGSSGSNCASTSCTTRANETVGANTERQSRDGHAGSTPRVLSRPRVGLNPTIPFSAAGTRPLPAVSVPRANGTTPAATATALPELLPPLMCSLESTQWHAPYGERVPTRPVANWSMFVLPMGMAPAASSCCDHPGVPHGRCRQRRARTGGWVARDVDVVLDGERHTEQAWCRGGGRGPSLSPRAAAAPSAKPVFAGSGSNRRMNAGASRRRPAARAAATSAGPSAAQALIGSRPLRDVGVNDPPPGPGP